MKNSIYIFIFFLFQLFIFNNTFSQTEKRYILLLIENEDSLYNITNYKCSPITDNSMNYIFYFCNYSGKTTSEFLNDTIVLGVEVSLQINSDDSLDYFTIKKIRKFYPETSIFNLKDINEIEEIKKQFLEVFNNAIFYYSMKNEQTKFLKNPTDLIILFKLVLIPQK
jgi:hypothetical protein